MAMVTKKYDIARLDNMMCEDVASLNFGEYDATTGGIENGRICELDHTNKQVKYASDIALTDLWLSFTVENQYEVAPLTEFMVEEGKKAGVKKIMVGDKFTTSACADTYSGVSVGDVMMLKAGTGELVAKGANTPAVEFTVRAKEVFGGLNCLYVERTK